MNYTLVFYHKLHALQSSEGHKIERLEDFHNCFDAVNQRTGQLLQQKFLENVKVQQTKYHIQAGISAKLL